MVTVRTRSPTADRGGGEAQAAAPPVDPDEQEQPDHVDEVPVPGGRLEADMLVRPERRVICAHHADREEDGADLHMQAVEAGGHVEGRAVDGVLQRETLVDLLYILEDLKACEHDTEADGDQERLERGPLV